MVITINKLTGANTAIKYISEFGATAASDSKILDQLSASIDVCINTLESTLNSEHIETAISDLRSTCNNLTLTQVTKPLIDSVLEIIYNVIIV